MKKRLALILAMLMLLSLVACSNTQSSDELGGDTTAETAPVGADTTEETEPDGADTTEETAPDGADTTEETEPDGADTTEETEPDGADTTEETEPDGADTTEETEPDGADTAEETEPDGADTTEETDDKTNNNDQSCTSHTYDNDCDTDCNVCGNTRVTTHAYDNDCDTDCNVCGDTRVTSHAYSRWNMLKAPTDSQTGMQEHVCTVCGLNESVTMPILTSTPLEYFTFEEYPISNVMYYKITGYTGSFEEVVVPRVYNGHEIRAIATDAFLNHTEIATMYIPDTVKLIEQAALNGCSGLRSLTIPFVGENFFRTYTQAKQYPFGYIFGGQYYSETVRDGMMEISQQYYGANTKNVTSSTFYIPQNLETVAVTGGSILHGAFMDCDSIKTLILPETCTTIRPYACNEMDYLEYVVLPTDLHTIGEYAFTCCYYLKKVELPNGLQSIGTYAFYSCKYGLQTVVIPKSVKVIGEKAFNGCDAMYRLWCEADSKPSQWHSLWVNDAYQNFGYVSGTDGIEYQLSADGSHYIVTGYTGSDELVYIANVHKGLLVTEIADSAFAGNTTIHAVMINSDIERIGSNAFEGCTALTKVFYQGQTVEQWNALEIEEGNQLLSGMVYYLHRSGYADCSSETCWKLISGVPTVHENN